VPPEPAAVTETRGLTGKIVLFTGFLLTIAGLIDAIIAVTNKTESLACLLVSFPWCPTPPPVLGPSAAPETPATRVNSFSIMVYNAAGSPAGGMQSAQRDWKRVTPDRWVENYPGGIPAYYDLVGRITLSDCPGTVVRNEVDQNHRVFIPDKGCAGMPFYISDDNKNWGIASAMTNVQ
jgi:hypothetical protein